MGYSQNWKKDRKTGEFRRQTKKLHTNCNMKQKLKAVTGKYQRWRETADWTVGEEGGGRGQSSLSCSCNIYSSAQERLRPRHLYQKFYQVIREVLISHTLVLFFSRRYEKQSHLNPRKQIPAWVFLWSWDHNTAQVLLHNVFCLFFFT